ncbi:MAG: TonB-dependent receptor [Vicinamibacterales bacterium]
MRFRLTRLLVVAAALFAFATPSSAQVFTGRIDVTAVDTTGAVLPGVTVDIAGPLNQSAVTDASGEAHFLNLPPGDYTVSARLQGFGDYINRRVPVVAGAGVPLKATLGVAGLTTAVEVTAGAPTIDPKRTTTSTNVTLEELQNIPSSRDPWVVMQTVPGIIVDRVNVGGAESGQQSNYQAKGAAGGQNTWNIDGIPITDMAATGASPTYYDFDMFQEMQVTTGGADVTNSTAGVHLNFVMKSGSNTPHGSFRGYFSNDGMQANNLPDELKGTSLVGESGKGNRTEQYSDYGGELGGPIVRDKWWAWGSWGKTDVRIRTITDVLDRTELNNIGFKTQAQLNAPWRVGFTYFLGDKVKDGRGASAFRPLETTWDQSGPTAIYKGEVNWVASNNLFFTARGAYSDMGFQLVPKGGLDAGKEPYRDVGRVWHNSFVFYKSDRPQHAVLADGNWFRGKHEVKFGFSWRRAGVESISQWPGSKVYTIHLSSYPTNGLMLPIFTGDQVRNNVGRYMNAYLGDTISFNRATINVGLRFDRSTSTLLEASRAGSPIVPDVLPALTTPAKENALEFNTITPRVGITYALDDDRKTLLRASYATFASQLGAADSGFVAGPTYYSYAYYLAIDANRDGITQANELITGALGSYGFDLADPSNVNSVNRIGDLKSPTTHEVLFGIDRELMRNVGVSGTLTWRRFDNLRWKPLIGVRRGDYVQAGTVSGNEAPIGSFDVPFYAPRAGVLPPGNGREELNRDGYHQRFLGFEISATKRMSNRWMARLGFSTNDHREYFDDPAISIEDPTPSPTSPYKDGGVVVTETGGSGKSDIFMVLPKYQFIANGLVQGPWGINLGANLVTRQGFGQPFYAETEVEDPSSGGLKNVLLVEDVGENRLPAVTSLDVRLEKAFRFNRANIMFDLDVFNVTNTNTVLGRQFDLNATPGDTGFNKIIEIMNPRILRLGLRVNF